MTAYTNIPTSDIDPESPITTSLMTALRDNPIAITEGAAGAPRIVATALAEYAAGNYSISRAQTRQTTSTSYVKLIEWLVDRPGTIRIRFTLSSSAGSNFAYGRVYKNGAAVGAERSTITQGSYSEDFSVTTGDLVQIYAKTQSSAESATISDALFMVAEPIGPSLALNYGA